MKISQAKLQELIKIMEMHYQGWDGFSDSKFIDDEIEYKWATISKAKERLNEQILRSLIDEGKYDEIVDRMDKLGKDNNLLYLRIPKAGDLNILSHHDLDKAGFSRAILDLLYGPGESSERLRRYIDYVNEHDLPNKWTFPTYFLFICHPETEVFIKPDTIRRFVEYLGEPQLFFGQPDPSVYNNIRQIANSLKSGLSQFGPKDMVDIQGMIWVVSDEMRGRVITEDKLTEFKTLFKEFADGYFQTDEGKLHVTAYDRSREVGKRNYERILRRFRSGENITDAVLLKLLPHAVTLPNQESGAWNHICPAIRKDIKNWFEGIGWAKKSDWPQIAVTILEFINMCDEDPGQLAAACEEFADSNYSKGFQSGILTPILNAINPDVYFLINVKPLKVINYFTGKKLGSSLKDYPEVNETAHRLIEQVYPILQEFELPIKKKPDIFDAFSHWLVAVKNLEFRNINYWKIAPGENAWNWASCLEGNFIAVGWDDMGDITGLKYDEFNQRRDEKLAEHSDWKKSGVGQVWTFSRIKEGDRIVANQGTKKILGIGTVTGPYFFVPGVRHKHRLPVIWDDLTPRQVEEGGWRRTLVKLDYEKFKKLADAPPIELADPFGAIFTDREEAEWAFDLMKEALAYLGVSSPDDKRFAVTLGKEGHMLRLDYGSWVVMQFCAPGYANHTAGSALIEDRAEIIGNFTKWETFANTNPRVSMYEFPVDAFRPLKGVKQKLFKETFDYIKTFFQNWQASSHTRFNQKEIAEAIFNREKRNVLFTKGIQKRGIFSQETFDLLEKLHENPTKDCYAKYKEESKQYLEDPFQRLFLKVVESLPPEITDVMETEKALFSRIPKNDYGRRGAWDHYWGAIYRKGGKRIEDAQLYIWMDYKCLGYGFYLGEYGETLRNKFQITSRQNRKELISILEIHSDKLAAYTLGDNSERAEVLEQGAAEHSEEEQDDSWREWISNPEKYNYGIGVTLPRDRVVQMSEDELFTDIRDAFIQLFPLILLSISDDPMPAIKRYLKITEKVHQPYSKLDALADLFITADDLDDILNLLDHKKNIILQGPPGVGKTFAAKKIAWVKMGEKNEERVEMVQFHQSYSYEDFVQGIRPKEPQGFEIKDGTFYNFCKRARRDQDNDYFMIIDEINRGNLSKIFGELMVLLEADKRGEDVTLAYGEQGVTFSIPKNVFIIGTMNTADRSLALVDYALRRRFCFIDLLPAFRTKNADGEGAKEREEKFREHLLAKGAEEAMIERVITALGELNAEISGDTKNLGPGFQIGHSYFCDCSRRAFDQKWYGTIIKYEIAPLLKEYWFDDLDRAEKAIDNLISEEIF